MFKLFRSESSQDSPVPYTVYPSSLFCLGLGYALWHPEPHETGEPQIGDVGYVSRGAFIRLFNINTSKEDYAVTFWDAPFEPTDTLPEGVFRADRRHAPIAPDQYRSRGVYRRETSGSVSV
ncbi:uncharacterized protein PHACADRAFT_248938 [Phanerochaete carnosa HHB-10118-sp]|uniref:Uncharacterized protein n=1 Tax=Phanerochaete carnosa (strain HHB-10118-sp) TaxID=650164 RepID=K5V7W6_PHACS|nr:uncharacterized protein PHACADRAFT_248938 [Phanerochaete carnosa HHB-10118-sp]EKM58841.1 hypothetical protein PHACADRAFT_248938 [Phanerochaete carnosa HHB-10118-sp]